MLAALSSGSFSPSFEATMRRIARGQVVAVEANQAALLTLASQP